MFQAVVCSSELQEELRAHISPAKVSLESWDYDSRSQLAEYGSDADPRDRLLELEDPPGSIRVTTVVMQSVWRAIVFMWYAVCLCVRCILAAAYAVGKFLRLLFQLDGLSAATLHTPGSHTQDPNCSESNPANSLPQARTEFMRTEPLTQAFSVRVILTHVSQLLMGHIRLRTHLRPMIVLGSLKEPDHLQFWNLVCTRSCNVAFFQKSVWVYTN
jgi:hypothetical protein